MEKSILNTAKKVLGMDETFSAFDEDVLVHVNAAFAILNQLGVGTPDFVVQNNSQYWDDFSTDAGIQHQARTYVILKTRLGFDPPTTSFHLQAVKDQIQEYEWRLRAAAEEAANAS